MVCPERGALGSLIHNETVELDNEMVVGIMKDVAMGMKFLHFSKIPTQDEELTPARVLLDSNYRAQLMHFQLHLVRNHAYFDRMCSCVDSFASWLWLSHGRTTPSFPLL